MSYLHPDDVFHSCPDVCHVCGQPLRSGDSAVTHDGHVRPTGAGTSGYGVIGLHIECATILSMRLIADVMKHKSTAHEPRVVISLRDACEKKLKEF
jgi:hypothetical protein